MFKNSKPVSREKPQETAIPVNRSFAVNRAFGQDITHKILNSSGAVALPNQGGNDLSKDKIRESLRGPQAGRKPSPSIHSNHQ